MPDRTCSQCDSPIRARGLCAAHYMATYRPRRKLVETPCAVCGAMVCKVEPANKRRPVCSNRCRYVLTYGRDAAEGREVVGPVGRRFNPKGKSVPGARPTTTTARFVAGSCRWCGAGYTFDLRVGGVHARYCGLRCARNAGRARRREARGQFAITRKRRLAIYERDGWVCQLCFEPIDREAHYLDDWAPSLDHIVPQSRQLVPDHGDGALRLSHRWCNAVRGDDTYHTAADLAPAPA